MRKRLITKLAQMYTRTFPPITPNGNNVSGDIKRTIIALLMNVVGGRKTEELLREVLEEFHEWYELHKEDLGVKPGSFLFVLKTISIMNNT